MRAEKNISSEALTLGFSPCPNDTFIFDALVNGKTDAEGLEFDIMMEDVEALNRYVLRNKTDISKISFAVFPEIAGNYQLLNSGSALGRGVGPLLISKTPIENPATQINLLKIAIPGKHTTADFLFSIFFPQAKNKTEYLFSEIEDAVLSGEADAGVIIHENRFTFESKGLKKIADLGELWEKKTSQPIPLGGIAVKKNFPEELKRKIDRVIRRSIEFAFSNPYSSQEFVKQHAQEMNEEVRRKHIELYVNHFSVNLGDAGRKAVSTLFNLFSEKKSEPMLSRDIFVEHTLPQYNTAL